MKTILMLAVGLTAVSAHAVTFGHPNFRNPDEYVSMIRGTPTHPAHDTADSIERALDAVVLIGGHGSGVIISPDGLMMSSKHVFYDISLAPGDERKIPLFLGHRAYADGSRDTKLTRIYAERVLVNEYGDDFVLLKLAVPPGRTLPYALPETDESAIRVGQFALAAGHPHAHNFTKGVEKVSDGPVVVYEPRNAELPHFLHLIDTEEGSSGGPVLSASGKVIGLHFRGIPDYPAGVRAIVKGVPTLIRRFNVALPVPYLVKKYSSALGSAF